MRALSLLPALGLEARSRRQEEKLLKRLAAWAERFTSFVAIEPRNVLLLEVAGSERLFDGIEALRRALPGAQGAGPDDDAGYRADATGKHLAGEVRP